MMAIPAIIRVSIILLFLVPGVALSIYWWANYAGLYRVLIEWQSKTFGGYLPLYTGILMVAVVGFVPTMLLMILIVQLNLFPVDPENPPPVSTEAGAAADLWFREHQGRVFGLIVGVMGTIAGGVMILVASSDPLRPLDLGALEAGQKPPSSYVTTPGRLLDNRMVTQRERTEIQYVPLVSPNWKEGMPIRVYVSIPILRRNEVNKGVVEGMLSENGLPGPVRVEFEKVRGAQPAQPHYLLSVSRKPETTREVGLFFLAVGLGSLFLTGLVWVVKARRQVG
jgi:hypothetical protein